MAIGAWRRRESRCDVVKEPAKMESKPYVSPSSFTGAPAKVSQYDETVSPAQQGMEGCAVFYVFLLHYAWQSTV